jgi:hypothetical protein
MMATLGSHPNVYETCLRMLVDRGWRITVAFGDEDEDECHSRSWAALRNAGDEDIRLCADNPIELLGLVNIWEARWPGTYAPWWWRQDIAGSSLQQQIDDEAERELQLRIDRFEAWREADSAGWEAVIRSTIKEYGDLSNSAAILNIPRTVLRCALERPELNDLRNIRRDP